jgi:hypothetical protein
MQKAVQQMEETATRPEPSRSVPRGMPTKKRASFRKADRERWQQYTSEIADPNGAAKLMRAIKKRCIRAANPTKEQRLVYVKQGGDYRSSP